MSSKKIYCIYGIPLNDDGTDRVYRTNVKGEKYPLGDCTYGFVTSLKLAQDIVENNKTDLVEFYYNWILIEEVLEGIPARTRQVQWYKASWKLNDSGNFAQDMRDAYPTIKIEKTDPPPIYKNIVNLSMG